MQIDFGAAATSSTEPFLHPHFTNSGMKLVFSGSLVHKSLHFLLSSIEDLEWLGLVRALE